MMRAHLAVLEKGANSRLDQSLGRRKERERKREGWKERRDRHEEADMKQSRKIED